MLPLLALLLSGPAEAAGYYTSDVGVRSFSRGGAYVAGPSDLLALWYNPAALTRVGDGTFTVNAAGVSQEVFFDRADIEGDFVGLDGDDLGAFGPVENGAPAYLIPHMGAAWDFGMEDTTIAFGFYPPYAPDYAYPQQGPQRYTLIDTLVIQTFSGVSAAHRFGDWVSVGAGLSWNLLIVEQALAVNMVGNAAAEKDDFIEDPAFDVAFSMAGRDDWAMGVNVGVLVEPPSNRWAVGAMVQSPVRFTAEGTLNADFSNHTWNGSVIKQDRARDSSVIFDVNMPLIVKAGALVRPIDTLEIEVATVYEGWSSIDQIVLTQVNLEVETATGPAAITDDIVLPAGYGDTWSWRLGGEWAAHEKLTLRAGGMFETAAIPQVTQSVGLLDGDKFGVGGGLTFRPHKRWAFDFGGFGSFIPEKRIDDSELRSIVVSVNPIAPEETAIVEGSNIGNGVLRSSSMILGGGVNWYFGKAPGRTGRLGHPTDNEPG
jgi:long-chain fatty acid transport protein